MSAEKSNKFATKKATAPKIATRPEPGEEVRTAKPRPSAPKAAPAKEVAPANDTRKIVLVTKENPKREGSASHDRFELYRKAKTVQQFLDAGGTTGDIRHDEKAGHITVS